MAIRAAAVAALALVCVFGAITLSVMRAREPLGGSVTQSFDARVTRLARSRATAVPLGCRKRSFGFYDCSAVLRPMRELQSSTVGYLLWLRDDGCWTAYSKGAAPQGLPFPFQLLEGVPPPPPFPQVEGCIAT